MENPIKMDDLGVPLFLEPNLFEPKIWFEVTWILQNPPVICIRIIRSFRDEFSAMLYYTQKPQSLMLQSLPLSFVECVHFWVGWKGAGASTHFGSKTWLWIQRASTFPSKRFRKKLKFLYQHILAKLQWWLDRVGTTSRSGSSSGKCQEDVVGGAICGVVLFMRQSCGTGTVQKDPKRNCFGTKWAQKPVVGRFITSVYLFIFGHL